MRPNLLVVALALLATPALAQFPPPGIYVCAEDDGTPLGELTLFVAGDYSFKGADGNSGSGQLASAGTDVNPLSGPLKDMGFTGAFGTDEQGVTLFRFSGPDGLVVGCE